MEDQDKTLKMCSGFSEARAWNGSTGYLLSILRLINLHIAALVAGLASSLIKLVADRPQ